MPRKLSGPKLYSMIGPKKNSASMFMNRWNGSPWMKAEVTPLYHSLLRRMRPTSNSKRSIRRTLPNAIDDRTMLATRIARLAGEFSRS